MVTDLLVTVFDITFDHKTFHHIVDIFGNAAVFKHFLGNTDLLFKMFAGVCVVCIYDNSHIFKISLAVNLMEKKQVFIMVVWKAASVFVYASAKDRMRKRISLCLYFLLAVDEMVAALGCFDGIKHNRKVTAGWVFHTTWNLNSAGSQAVLLVFYRTRADSDIRKNVRKIFVIFRVKHFIGTRHTRLLYDSDMRLTDRMKTFEHVLFFFRIRLACHSFISFSGRSWFIGINTRNDKNFICDLFLDFCQAQGVVNNSFFVIC